MKNPIIRTIYLYLFALIGLALLASGTYSFIDLGLRTYVFTEADRQYERQIINVPEVKGEVVIEVEIDYAKSQRQRQASSALARILVGFPLYLYHWSVIKKDVKKQTK